MHQSPVQEPLRVRGIFHQPKKVSPFKIMCESSRQNAVLKTPALVGMSTDAVWSALPAVHRSVCLSVCLCTDSVNTTAFTTEQDALKITLKAEFEGRCGLSKGTRAGGVGSLGGVIQSRKGLSRSPFNQQPIKP